MWRRTRSNIVSVQFQKNLATSVKHTSPKQTYYCLWTLNYNIPYTEIALTYYTILYLYNNITDIIYIYKHLVHIRLNCKLLKFSTSPTTCQILFFVKRAYNNI